VLLGNSFLERAFLELPATAASGAMVGTASFTFGQSATLQGQGALQATSGIVFGQSGSITGLGALTGTASFTFGQSGTLGGLGQLTGTATVTFSQTGDLQSLPSGAMVGTAAIIFGQSGTLLSITPALDDVDWSGHDGKKRKQQHEYAYDDYAKRKHELEAIIAKAVKTVDPETDTSAEVLDAIDNAPKQALQSISNVVLEYRKLIQLKLDEDIVFAMMLLQ
jgi:hypothetical protein